MSIRLTISIKNGSKRPWIWRKKNTKSSGWVSKNPTTLQVYKGLSRYYDINYLHDLAEAESGWDMTPRFDRRALNYLPVDLNALLYKYETDFARNAPIFDDAKTADV